MKPLADLGGRARRTLPPTGPNSFIFAYYFTEKHPCQRSMPPPSWRTGPPSWKTLTVFVKIALQKA